MLDLYDDYLQDPSSVPEDLQVLFSTIKTGEAHVAKPTTGGSGSQADSTIKRVMRLIDNSTIRTLKSRHYPVNPPERKHVPKLGIEDFDLDQQTLEQISAGIVSEHFEDIYDNAYEAIVRMEKRYKGPIAFDTLTLIT